MALYVAVNKLIPGFAKIGISRDVESRMADLYGAWEAVRVWGEHGREIELRVKHRLKKFRVDGNGHELFNCPVAVLVEEIENAIASPPETQEVVVQHFPNARVYEVENTKHIGALIRRSRKHQRVTLATTAGLCDVGVRFLSEVERGKETVELARTIRVLARLGLSLQVRSRVDLGTNNYQ